MLRNSLYLLLLKAFSAKCCKSPGSNHLYNLLNLCNLSHQILSTIHRFTVENSNHS